MDADEMVTGIDWDALDAFELPPPSEDPPGFQVSTHLATRAEELSQRCARLGRALLYGLIPYSAYQRGMENYFFETERWSADRQAELDAWLGAQR